jgi:hypothetical protein
MIRFTGFDPYFEKAPTICGALAGWLLAALSFVGEVAMQLLGVPLPVVMAAAAGAGAARSFMEAVGFVRALAMTVVWTIIGCTGAPLAQVVIKAAGSMAGAQVDLPTNTLAGAAAVLASVPWWGPKVWPFIAARLGLSQGGSNA